MFEIGNVVETLVEMRSLLNCKDLKEAWDNYMHDSIKQEYSFEEVNKYIEDHYVVASAYEL